MEPIIHEAYDLLTGHKTRESGFWTLTDEENPLKGKISSGRLRVNRIKMY